MAFGAKHSTLVNDYEFVVEFDPAFDNKAEGFGEKYQKYLETGDLDLLPRHPGQEPTIFRLQHLKGEAAEIILQDFQRLSPEELQSGFLPRHLTYRAAAMALVGWRNFTSAEGGDIPFPPKQLHRDGTMRVPESAMAVLQQATEPPGLIPWAIGTRVIWRLIQNPLS